MFHWVRGFLFQRTARVKLNGCLSQSVRILEGVPQGGVISSVLFLIYINAITSSVPNHVTNALHVDAFSVMCASEHTGTAVYRIRQALQNVQAWADDWRMSIDRMKTRGHTFPPGKRTSQSDISGNEQLPQTDTPIFLGM